MTSDCSSIFLSLATVCIGLRIFVIACARLQRLAFR